MRQKDTKLIERQDRALSLFEKNHIAYGLLAERFGVSRDIIRHWLQSARARRRKQQEEQQSHHGHVPGEVD